MLDRIARWAATLDLTGVVELPVWAVAAALTVAVVVAVLALLRAGADGRSLPAALLVLIAIVGACWWVGDYLAGRDRANGLQHVLCFPRFREKAIHAGAQEVDGVLFLRVHAHDENR